MASQPSKPPRRRLHKTKPTERAILMTAQWLWTVNEETGEIGDRVPALTPFSPLDRRLFREKNIRPHDVVVTDCYTERNYRFYRLWHQLAKYMIENHIDFEGMKTHPALKKLQLESGVHCEMEEHAVDLGVVLGKHTFQVKKTKSLNFFDTDETMAQVIWDALVDHVLEKYFGDFDEEQRKDLVYHWERYEQ